MNDLEKVLKEAAALSSDIEELLRLSSYDKYDDLSGLKINYKDLEQLLLLDELRLIMEKLGDAKRHIDYLRKPVRFTGILFQNSSGKYELKNGHYYSSGSNIEVLISDDYRELPYWVRSRVEYDGDDYYIVGFKDISLEGLTARVRSL